MDMKPMREILRRYSTRGVLISFCLLYCQPLTVCRYRSLASSNPGPPAAPFACKQQPHQLSSRAWKTLSSCGVSAISIACYIAEHSDVYNSSPLNTKGFTSDTCNSFRQQYIVTGCTNPVPAGQ
jgi:hypothetical protein